MDDPTLGRIGGEFTCRAREAAFQADRLPETMRHARLILVIAVVLNSLALASDWRFYGQPQFYIAVPARLMIVAASLACLFLAPRARTFRDLQRFLIGWEIVATAGVAALVTSRSDIALLVVLVLPSILILVVPTAFRWTVTFGVGSSLVLLAAYLLPLPLPPTAIGLLLVSVIQILALLLVVMRSNRMRRVEWSTVEAHRLTNVALEESKRLFETMFKAVPIPIVVSTAATGRIISMNDAALRFFGIVGSDALDDVFTRDLTPTFARRLVAGEIDRTGTVRDLEIPVLSRDGRHSDVLISADQVELGGETCVVSSLVDITSRKEAEERIRIAAHHDVLTGLPNRALFQITLESAFARAQETGSSLGLILIDLDGFKEINDTLGHGAGDIVLKEAARRLRRAVEAGDLVARLGGDEFVVVVSGGSEPVTGDRLQALAETILDSLDPALPLGGRFVAPRASLGLAVYPDHGIQAADLFTNADLALYAAKGAGRRRATLFVPSLRAEIEARMRVALEMRVTLDEGGLVPFYQPKIDFRDGRVVGFEALARWQHPSRGLLTPADFISAFDDPEIGFAVGQCLMRQICTDVAAWIAQGLDPGRVFLNLSSAQFAQADLSRAIFGEIRRAGLTPDRIGIEVTETVLLGGHGDRVAAVLETLRAGGLGIALDDFGTGYASLTHLKQFPVSEIKIDRSFVRDLERDPNDAAIVAAVIQLGRSLGLSVTAEGVETEAQARFLRENRCDNAQGYLYSRPMAQSRVPGFLQNHPSVLGVAAAAEDMLRIA